ncbi:hypothetical protein ACMGE9_01155 [Macrococcus sp. EM39E]|uniref:hypothetical protein n=1 Tax=Macrococcus animalis TaxID=3395467 RepID=UPI0039C0001D
MTKNISIELPSKNYLSDLYYWMFEDERQESAKWNGPYYPRPTTELDKEEFITKKIEINY